MSLEALRGPFDWLVFDVDDTVTAHGRLQSVALGAMERAATAGLRLGVATGRPFGWARVFAATWPVDFAVGENGAAWVIGRSGRSDEGSHLAQRELTTNRARLDRLEAVLRDEVPEAPLSQDHALRVWDRAWDIGEHVRLPEARCERLLELIAAHGFHTARSSVHAHAIASDWSKPRGVLACLAALGCDARDARERVVYVGDSPNDAEAFATFTHSVGVANVTRHFAHLAHRPRYVTREDRGRGFAELVDHLIAERRR